MNRDVIQIEYHHHSIRETAKMSGADARMPKMLPYN